MHLEDVLKEFRKIILTLSRVYFKIYRGIEDDTFRHFWYDLCEKKQKLAGEIIYCEDPEIKPEIDISKNTLEGMKSMADKILSEIPDILDLEEALRITYKLESSLINEILVMILYKIRKCIPGDISGLINVPLPQHIIKVLDVIIAGSKDTELVKRAHASKQYWTDYIRRDGIHFQS